MLRHALVALLLLTGCSSDTEPAAERVVALTVTDALRFDPSTVAAKAGEKVRFEIRNTGKVNHEFAIGDATFHAKHATEMAASPSQGHGGHEDSAVDVPAGSTATLEFTMPDQAPTFACYVDSHDKAGMKGMVTYS